MKKAAKVVVGAFLGFVILIVGIAIISGVVGKSGGKVSTPNYPQDPASIAQTTTQAPSGPLTTVGDGTYLVGTDMAPGSYRSPGSNMCYYARLRHNDGSVGDIIDNNVGSGPQRFTANEGETVKISGGCEFVKVG